VETDDGHVVTWRRKSGKVSYVIDGEEVHRVGRGNLPDGLHEVLRLSKVAHPNGRDEFDVHVGCQKSPIFLIDREGDAAAFFSTASDAEKLLEVQGRHREKVKERRRQHRELTAEVAELDGILLALAPLDVVEAALKSVEREHAELLDDEARAKELGLLIGELENWGRVAKYHRLQGTALGELRAPPALEETWAIEEHARKVAEAGRRVEADRARSAALEGVAQPPELEDEASLLALGKRLALSSRRAQALESAVGALEGLVEPPGVEDAAPLALAIEKLAKGSQAEGHVRRGIKAIDAEFEGVEEQISEWLWANPNCPTCGAETTREGLLGGEHAHVGDDHE
jgi:exonuclease SbcC